MPTHPWQRRGFLKISINRIQKKFTNKFHFFAVTRKFFLIFFAFFKFFEFFSFLPFFTKEGGVSEFFFQFWGNVSHNSLHRPALVLLAETNVTPCEKLPHGVTLVLSFLPRLMSLHVAIFPAFEPIVGQNGLKWPKIG